MLVNNAGFNRAKTPLAKVTPEELDASFAVNVRAPILLAREALKDMAPRKSGHIINVISSVAHTSIENYSVYSTMKYALHGFTGCLIKEARQVGVKVTGVYPGGVDTTFRPECSSGLHASGVGSADDCSMHYGTRRRRGSRVDLPANRRNKFLNDRKEGLHPGVVYVAEQCALLTRTIPRAAARAKRLILIAPFWLPKKYSKKLA